VKVAKLAAGYLMSERGKAHRASAAAFLGNAADKTGLSTAANTVMKGIPKTWNFLSGNTLLEKHGGEPMDDRDENLVRTLGMYTAMIGSAITIVGLGAPRSLIGFVAIALTSAVLGAAMGSLPRNAYVACKAKKEADMKREASGRQPQPPQV
jgi:hypothetical protein